MWREKIMVMVERRRRILKSGRFMFGVGKAVATGEVERRWLSTRVGRRLDDE
jgi:hypothetical protein